MPSASEQFLAKVHEAVDQHGLDWDTAWQQTRVGEPALYGQMLEQGQTRFARNRAQVANERGIIPRNREAGNAFVEQVHQHMRKTGKTYEEAWADCLRSHAQLANDAGMTVLSRKVSMTEDGQELIPAGRPSAEYLMKLGVPANASEEEIRIFVRAKETTVTPDAAAHIIVALCRHEQLQRGMRFEEAMQFLKTNMPEVWAAARTI